MKKHRHEDSDRKESSTSSASHKERSQQELKEYDSMKQVADWILSLRDEYCPVTSYNARYRSISSFIDISKSQSSETKDPVAHVLTQYLLTQSPETTFRQISMVSPGSSDQLEQVRLRPSHEDETVPVAPQPWVPSASAGSLLHIDLPTLRHLSATQTQTQDKPPAPTESIEPTLDEQSKTQSQTQGGLEQVCAHVRGLLNGPDAFPMLVLSVLSTGDSDRSTSSSSSSPVSLASDLPELLEELRGAKQDSKNNPTNPAAPLAFRCVSTVAAGVLSVACLIPQSSNAADLCHFNDPSVPSPASRGQFVMIQRNWDLYSRVRQMLGLVMPRLRQSVQQLQDHLESVLASGERDDDVIYASLRHQYRNVIVNNSEHAEVERQKQQAALRAARNPGYNNSKRTHQAPRRVTDILACLPPRFSAQSRDAKTGFNSLRLLDVGCSEGSVTASLGEALNISVENRIGVDVRDLPKTDGFTFKLTGEDEALPVEPDSVHIYIP